MRFWEACLCFALKRWFERGGYDWVAMSYSRYLPRPMLHFVFVRREEMAKIEVEEAVPEGPKQKGWRGLWHGLTARNWRVVKRQGD